jgi:hypothetical protein
VATFLEAAEIVLRAEQAPLSTVEICRKAIDRGLLKSQGKTPEASMASVIYVSMKRSGPQSRFVRMGRGRIGLASWKGAGRHETREDSHANTFKAAAILVLTESGKPLDVQTITTKALRQGYIRTTGKTPSATMGAQLYVDVKRRKDDSVFVQLGKNLFGLRKWDISALRSEIEKEEKEERRTGLTDIHRRSIVGDPINVEGLIYGPLNENGVIFLFSKIQDKLPEPISIEAIQPAFPDAKGRRKTEKGWVDIWIEFEYKSSHFKQHRHPLDACDIIVCWEHDWKDCPIEVIELRSVLTKLALPK